MSNKKAYLATYATQATRRSIRLAFDLVNPRREYNDEIAADQVEFSEVRYSLLSTR